MRSVVIHYKPRPLKTVLDRETKSKFQANTVGHIFWGSITVMQMICNH